VFVTFGLYLVLIGMPVGIVRDVRMASVVVVGYVALFGFNIGLWAFLGLLSSETVRVTLICTGPLALFVGGYAILFIRQARAREQAQELLQELEVAHAQLADYVERVEDLTLTAERQRMARELHDTLAQGLAGLILQLEAVDSHLASQHSARAREIVQQAMARARATLADARRAIDDLRVDDISKGDLAQVVQEEISRFTAATGIPCNCDLDSLSTIPVALHEHALRAVTEGLTNVARHAQANQVWVSAEQRDGMLAIEVRDNGIGFEPVTIAQQVGHYGLLGMRERARLAGGSLEIMSAPSVGTTICLRLPGNNGGGVA
jgi:two-component system, NarL family, sensor histidine kinase YdfH